MKSANFGCSTITISTLCGKTRLHPLCDEDHLAQFIDENTNHIDYYIFNILNRKPTQPK